MELFSYSFFFFRKRAKEAQATRTKKILDQNNSRGNDSLTSITSVNKILLKPLRTLGYSQ